MSGGGFQLRAVGWVGFGNQDVLADNDPVEQEKAMKFNSLLTNAVIFHNVPDIPEIVRQLLEEGGETDPELGNLTSVAAQQNDGVGCPGQGKPVSTQAAVPLASIFLDGLPTPSADRLVAGGEGGAG
ncbi:Tn3 family transposase [Streptomyces sp. NPDC003016]